MRDAPMPAPVSGLSTSAPLDAAASAEGSALAFPIHGVERWLVSPLLEARFLWRSRRDPRQPRHADIGWTMMEIAEMEKPQRQMFACFAEEWSDR